MSESSEVPATYMVKRFCGDPHCQGHLSEESAPFQTTVRQTTLTGIPDEITDAQADRLLRAVKDGARVSEVSGTAYAFAGWLMLSGLVLWCVVFVVGLVTSLRWLFS